MSSDDKKPTVTPMPNGPYVVKDLPALANQQGPIEMAKSTIALRRCGKSETKPFCDGAHETAGFSSDKEKDRREDAVDRYEGEGVAIEDNRGGGATRPGARTVCRPCSSTARSRGSIQPVRRRKRSPK